MAAAALKFQKSAAEAFDAARKALHDRGQPTVVYEVMALRIVAAARKGQRDVWRLRSAGIRLAFALVRTVD